MYLTHYQPLKTSWDGCCSWDKGFLSNFFSNDEERIIKPRTNIHEDDKHYFLEMELPGVDKKDVSIETKDQVLIIKGKKEHSKKKDTHNMHLSESWSGQFRREFDMGDTIDLSGIKAKHQEGVLEITLPKKAEAKQITQIIDIA